MGKKQKKKQKSDYRGYQPQAEESFYHWEGEVLVVNILGKPLAARDRIGKVQGNQLQVSVTAKPVGGNATDHMVRFLATEFGVKHQAIEVVYGRMNVNKQLRIRKPQILPRVFSCRRRVAGG